MSPQEAAHAYAPDDAVKLFERSVTSHVPIEGLHDLRARLVTSLDHQVLEQIKAGNWRLVDKAAYSFDWQDYATRNLDLSPQDFSLFEVPKKVIGLGIGLISRYRQQPLRGSECTHGPKDALETKISAAYSGVVECQHSVHNADTQVWINRQG
jgi:hypothetical protein